MGIYKKHEVVLIDDSKMSANLFDTLKHYQGKLDGRNKELLRRTDFLRWSYVLDQLPKNRSIMDVGVGAGQFIHAMSTSDRKFKSIKGLDITRHSEFISDNKNLEMIYASIGEIPLNDNSVDIVTCLEVIEHLNSKLMLQGVKELRRVAKSRMILTVPYCEKEPLPHFHKQRFDMARLKRIFPRAKFTFFTLNSSMAWVMIDERL